MRHPLGAKGALLGDFGIGSMAASLGFGGPVGLLDPDAADWRARVLDRGGSVSRRSLRALSDQIKALKAAGLWAKIERYNAFMGDQLVACLVPQKIGAGSAIDTNVNFVSGDYTEATGLTGNGTSKHLNTGLAQSALSASSRHLAVYERVRSAVTGKYSIGSAQAASTQFWAISSGFSDATGIYYLAGSDTSGIQVLSGLSPGFFIANSPSATTSTVYRNGASVASGAQLSATPGASSIYLFALNNNGTTANRSAATLAGYSIGTSLTDADAAAYNTIMEAFQDALGRGVQ